MTHIGEYPPLVILIGKDPQDGAYDQVCAAVASAIKHPQENL